MAFNDSDLSVVKKSFLVQISVEGIKVIVRCVSKTEIQFFYVRLKIVSDCVRSRRTKWIECHQQEKVERIHCASSFGLWIFRRFPYFVISLECHTLKSYNFSFLSVGRDSRFSFLIFSISHRFRFTIFSFLRVLDVCECITATSLTEILLSLYSSFLIYPLSFFVSFSAFPFNSPNKFSVSFFRRSALS